MAPGSALLAEQPVSGANDWHLVEFHLDEATDDGIDEIVVQGEKSMSQLRHEIRDLETEIFDLYNSPNEDADYDIVCRRESRIDSQIPRRRCEANIYWEALADASADDESSVPIRRPLSNPDKYVKTLRDNMLRLAKENPELLEALGKRRMLVVRYEELRGSEEPASSRTSHSSRMDFEIRQIRPM